MAGRSACSAIRISRNANSIKQQIGIQLQTTGLYPLHTVHELLDLFGSFYDKRLPPDDLIKLVSLEDKRNTRSKNLSGGQRQRLSLALALVNDPAPDLSGRANHRAGSPVPPPDVEHRQGICRGAARRSC